MAKLSASPARASAFVLFLAMACPESEVPRGGYQSGCSQDPDCATGYICVNRQCTPVSNPDAGLDGGPQDAGPFSDADVVADAGPDAGPDAGSGVDAGLDGSVDASVDAGPGKTLGQTCQFSSECQSGYCIQTNTMGRVCSVSCSADCPVGWGCRVVDVGGGNYAQVCFPAGDLYCVPCTNGSCSGSGERCVNVGGANYCTQGCETRSCAQGYTCTDVSVTADGGQDSGVDAGTTRQCLPADGGLCPGCIDGDGDQYGIGANCLGPDCNDGNQNVFGAVSQTSVTNCGTCGNNCTNANGATICDGGVCVPTCNPGYWDCNGNRNDGCEAALDAVTSCGTCDDGGTCPTSFFCNSDGGTSCLKKHAQGETCGSAIECTSGYCFDGRCCAGDCSGTCRYCNVSGNCVNYDDGTDPEGECQETDGGKASCGLDGMCNGAGACRYYSAITECVSQSCSGGVRTNTRLCNGSGVCNVASPPTTSCGIYGCNVAGTDCRTDCDTDNDCASGYSCYLNGPPPHDCRKAMGQSCDAGGLCATENCVDYVCCENSCSGPCVGCNTDAGAGFCTPHTAGTDPDNDCADAGASTCGNTGVCDGQGACQKWPAGTECAGGACGLDGGGSYWHLFPRVCDGNGTCLANSPASENCAPNVCSDAGTCLVNCTSDSNCAGSGYFCTADAGVDGGQCVTKKPAGQPCPSGNHECTSNACCSGTCRDLQNDESYCGSCSNACTNSYGSNICDAGICRPTCSTGYASCDSNNNNGCERSIRTTTDCNGCGVSCSRTNAYATCSTGACQISSCYYGYANCDSNDSNGCERQNSSYSNTFPGESLGSYDADSWSGWPVCIEQSCTFGTSRSGTQGKYFTIGVNESDWCSAYISAMVELAVPAGSDFDLFVTGSGFYCQAWDGSQWVASCSGERGTGYTEKIRFWKNDTSGTDDDFTANVEVRYFSGSTCSSWTLSVYYRNCVN